MRNKKWVFLTLSSLSRGCVGVYTMWGWAQLYIIYPNCHWKNLLGVVSFSKCLFITFSRESLCWKDLWLRNSIGKRFQRMERYLKYPVGILYHNIKWFLVHRVKHWDVQRFDVRNLHATSSFRNLLTRTRETAFSLHPVWDREKKKKKKREFPKTSVSKQKGQRVSINENNR